MAKLAIIGTIETAPGRTDEVLGALMAHRERCLRDEPGTLQFEVLKPRDSDNTILLYEVYRDDAAFKAHWEGSSSARTREETRDMIVKLVGTRCSLQEQG